MRKSAAEVLEFINQRLSTYLSGSFEGIAESRAQTIRKIAAHIARNGFPKSRGERYELSLIPFLYQEANYDGIRWGPDATDFADMQDLFDLDFYVQTEGQERSAASPAEREQYYLRALKYIDKRTGHSWW